MAPEIMGDEKYSNKVDIYGFGITLWEVATSKVPFDEIKDDKAKIIQAVTGGQRPPIAADTPKVIKEVIEKCWAPDPNARPAAKDLLVMMQTLLSSI